MPRSAAFHFCKPRTPSTLNTLQTASFKEFHIFQLALFKIENCNFRPRSNMRFISLLASSIGINSVRYRYQYNSNSHFLIHRFRMQCYAPSSNSKLCNYFAPFFVKTECLKHLQSIVLLLSVPF